MRKRFATLLKVSAVLLMLFPAAESRSQEPMLSALPLTVSAPADNPQTPEKIALGRLLFWDPILSGTKDVACASCHQPRFGYAENRDISIGVNGTGLGERRRFNSPNSIPFVKRNSPTVVNSGFIGTTRTG